MRNEISISSVLLISALLAACGQSGPLYMPGQATGVHKKDVFIFGGDQSKTQTPPVTKEPTTNQTKTSNNTEPATTSPSTNATTNQTFNFPVTNAGTN